MNTKRRRKIVILGLSSLVLIALSITLFLTIHKEKDNDVFMHISFDDSLAVFEDLTNHSNTYDSIFDNDFLSYLKNLHDNYGAVFSLYCYGENDHFNLSKATDQFASEFSMNKDWLKFGYHGTNGEEKMADVAASVAVSIYENVINELIRITGGMDAIDTVPRLHYFSGNEPALLALTNANHGSNGFLTAEDDRDSYYLKGDENLYIANHDFFKDDNGIYFVSTDLRLDNTLNPYSSLIKIADDENQNKCIEVFTHEWQFGDLMKLKLWATCFFAYKEGYSWDYPMYRYEQ